MFWLLHDSAAPPQFHVASTYVDAALQCSYLRMQTSGMVGRGRGAAVDALEAADWIWEEESPVLPYPMGSI